MITKAELMKRYLRGDYKSLTTMDVDGDPLYWRMCRRAWVVADGITYRPPVAWSTRPCEYAGSDAWWDDIHDLMKELGHDIDLHNKIENT